MLDSHNTDMNTDPSHRQTKHAFHWALLLCGTLLCIEVVSASYVLLMGKGRMDSWAQQNAIIRSGGVTSSPDDVEELNANGRPDPGRIIHPYLGVVLTKRRPEIVFNLPTTGTGTSILKRSDTTVIIAMIGGSVAKGLATHTQRSGDLLNILKNDPHFAKKQLRFINLAIAGMKQPQQLMYLSYLLSLGAEIDILINVDGFNEFNIASFLADHGKVFPIYPEIWASHTELKWNDARMVQVAEIQKLRKKRVQLAQIGTRFPLRYSSLIQFLWGAYDNHLERAVITVEIETPDSTALGYEEWKQYVSQGPWDEKYTDHTVLYPVMADIWARSSMAIEALARVHNIQYYHFLQPNQYIPNTKPMEKEESEAVLGYADTIGKILPYGYALLQERAKTLQRSNVQFYDLTQVFQGHSERLYRDNCCHLNAEGNEVMGKAIAEYILSGTL